MVGWFQKLSAGLSKTREAVTGRLDRLLGRAADPALLDELEVALISADLGLPVVERIMDQLRTQMRGGNFSSAESVRELLRRSILDILLPAQSAPMHQLVAQGPHPFVILVVGVNGVGKTTTIAKLTQRFRQEGKSPPGHSCATTRLIFRNSSIRFVLVCNLPAVSMSRTSDPRALAAVMPS